MKATLATSFLVVVLGAAVFAQERTQPQPVVIADGASAGSSDKIRSFYAVAPVNVLQDSSGQTERLFLSVDISVGQLDTDRYKLILSSAPDANRPFVVDDAVFVNGKKITGFTQANEPFNHLGEDPAVCYQGVPATDVTSCLHHDGHVIVQAMDLDGAVYGCSALYLRVVPK